MESESYLQGSSESHGQEVAALRFTRCQMGLNLCDLNHSPNWKSGRSRLKSPAMWDLHGLGESGGRVFV